MKFFKRIANFFSMIGHFSIVFVHLISGIWKISKLNPPIVTIFGGTRLAPDSTYIKEAHMLAGIFVNHNISVITGGGPGIMEASNCGAIHKSHNGNTARSVGITVKGLEEYGVNPCVSDTIVTDHFFVRKWLMVHYSWSFIVFPGGFGTLDELGEILTLMQTNNIKQAPIILIGKEYWADLLNWMEFSALKHGLITQAHFEYITSTDDIHEAFKIVKNWCDKMKASNS